MKTKHFVFYAGEHMKKYTVKHIVTNAKRKATKENIVGSNVTIVE